MSGDRFVGIIFLSLPGLVACLVSIACVVPLQFDGWCCAYFVCGALGAAVMGDEP